MALRPRYALLAAVLALVMIAGHGPAARALNQEHLDQRYEISATLDVAGRRLDATVELELTNRSVHPLDHVDLSLVPRALGWLVSDDLAVTVDGAPVDAEWTTTINLRVPVDGLAVGETAVIRVPYVLVVGRAPDAFTARTSVENGVLSFGQWFPILSTEHDVYGLGDPQISFTASSIRFDLTTTTPLPRDAVACPGLVAAPATTGTQWSCEVDQVRDFSFVLNPRFRLTTRTLDDHQVRVYTETVTGSRTAELALEGLTTLEQAFGPYPWDDLVLAEIGSAGGFSMEYPRMIHLTRDKVADPYVIHHEVAHQWFYAQLGNDQQEDPWLDEAFADFGARYVLGIGENQCSNRAVDSSVFAWEAGAVTGGDWTSCDGYFHAVFYRGTEFLTAIRRAMGDDAFFGALRDWVDRHRHGFTTGDGLLRHFLRRADADLLPIFAVYLEDADPRPSRRPPSGRGVRPI